VTKQKLDGAHIGASLKQVGGKRVSQRVRGEWFLDILTTESGG
jgi:hypothetical protein